MSLRFAALVGAFNVGLACTWVGVNTKDGKDVIGRSMELDGKASDPLKKNDPYSSWDLQKVAAGTPVTPATHSGARCATMSRLDTWTVKYSYVGVGGLGGDTDGPDLMYDGMNTEGLIVDEQSLHQSVYMHPPILSDNSTRVCFTSVTAYFLGLFATVAEVKAALTDPAHPFYIITNDPELIKGGYVHWAVADRFHEKIVVEVLNGALNIHNNTVRVMTNDPPFDFQLHNLQHFANLNTNWPDRSAIAVDSEVGSVPMPDVHGNNLLGLPGDFTPSSRFAKMFYLRQFAETNIDIDNADDAFSLVQGLLNSVHIPKGVVAFTDGENYEFTQYATMKNLQDRMYYFRTYDDMQWKAINLTKVKWVTKAEKLAAFDGTPLDISDTF